MTIDFVAFDVETANVDRGSICAVGWTVVRDGQIVETSSLLCQPPEPVSSFSAFNTAIHGITATDVAGQPRYADVVPSIISGFGDLPIVAHNAAFDIGAVREAHTHCAMPWPTLSYGCTLVWSRRLLDLPSHRLPIVCEHLGYVLDHHHDAGADASAAAHVTMTLAELVGAKTIDELLDATNSNLGTLRPSEWVGCRATSARAYTRDPIPLPLANLDADPDNPLYGQVVAFTGGLSTMTRSVAEKCVADAGGAILSRGVTRKTNVLVLGDGFCGETLGDFVSTRKSAKALEYRARGQAIEFWSELDFVESLRTCNAVPLELEPIDLDTKSPEPA